MSTDGLYSTLAAFYAERPERRRSPEADYGVHWHAPGETHPLWKLSHVKDTGELYVEAQSPPHVVGLAATVLPVTRDMDVILSGWEDSGITGGWNLDWVSSRVVPRGLDCPYCGRLAGFAIEDGDQAFCSNDDCPMFSWEPGKTLAEIVHEATVVNLPPDLTEIVLGPEGTS